MLRKRILSALLALALLAPATASATEMPKEGMRGVWVATVYNIDYPTRQGMTADELKSEADAMLDNIKAMGLNTVFFQARPSSDALYESDLFPWSRYISGASGQAPDGGFDPLAYWIEGAHARGLQLHAWLNPYRITKGGKSELDALPDDSPAKQHPEWVIAHEDNYYFDPGLPAVQQLVIDGAREIVRNYDVDGIHLDDYFYPGTDFNDGATYARYGENFDNLGDWRRDNVDTLVSGLHETLHGIDPTLSFGISPAGIWDNKNANPRGSDTNGRSSYSEIYCDSLKWVEENMVDYICPQLYWSIGFTAADFTVLTEWWQDAVATSNAALYIGLGAYRMAEAAPGDTWHGTDELRRQLTLLDQANDIQGEVYFSYSSLINAPNAADLLTAHYTEKSQAPSLPDADAQQAGSLLDLFSRFLLSLFH